MIWLHYCVLSQYDAKIELEFLTYKWIDSINN